MAHVHRKNVHRKTVHRKHPLSVAISMALLVGAATAMADTTADSGTGTAGSQTTAREADDLTEITVTGVRESQIESVSLGEEKPACADQTEECWAKNRRGDVLYGGEY